MNHPWKIASTNRSFFPPNNFQSWLCHHSHKSFAHLPIGRVKASSPVSTSLTLPEGFSAQAEQVRSSKVTLGGDLGRGHGPRRWGVGDRPNPRDLENSRPGKIFRGDLIDIWGENGQTTRHQKWPEEFLQLLNYDGLKYPDESYWGLNLYVLIFHLHSQTKNIITVISPPHPKPFEGSPSDLKNLSKVWNSRCRFAVVRSGGLPFG